MLTDFGDAALGDCPPPNPLREQMRDADEAKRVIARLVNKMLPKVELFDVQARRETLQAYASGRAVIYFVPGDKDEAYDGGRPTPDTAQHRGYVNRKAIFEAMRVTVISVSSQPVSTLLRVGHYFDFSHFMLSDPDLATAYALDLPTVQNGDIRHYQRLTLVATNARIVKVFYPVLRGSASGNARQVMAWMQAGGWQ
jgi:peroxiredoxin